MSEYEYGIRRIAEYYGLKQLKKLAEEIWELNEAIMCDKCQEDITEEIADCYVIMEQIEYLTCIDKQDIEKVKEHKVGRQLMRIKSENSLNGVNNE